jgi:hypothetical protein
MKGIKNNSFYKERGHRIYSDIRYTIEESIKELGYQLPNENVLSYISFMNFFQRPADNNEKTIGYKSVRGVDIFVANETIKEVIEIINPEFLFFLNLLK